MRGPVEQLKLGKPALVCRWRLWDGRLPLENRHLRALAARTPQGVEVTPGLVGWAKQHIEWSLKEGSQAHPDGVLMLVLDEEGRAAMTVGPYRPLKKSSANDLLWRAQGSWREAKSMGVSPEDLWTIRGDTLMWATSSEFAPSGASSLIADLAKTLGMPVIRRDDLLKAAATQGFAGDEVFLVSDEHGVVAASDRSGARAHKFVESYHRLLQHK